MKRKLIALITVLSLGISGAVTVANSQASTPVPESNINYIEKEKQDLIAFYNHAITKMFFYNNVAVANHNPYYYEVADSWLERANLALDRIEAIERQQKLDAKTA